MEGRRSNSGTKLEGFKSLVGHDESYKTKANIDQLHLVQPSDTWLAPAGSSLYGDVCQTAAISNLIFIDVTGRS